MKNVYIELIITGFIVTAAAIDLRTRRVPLWLTLPVMVAGGIYQATIGRQWVGLLIAWTAIFLLWKLRFYGGGDAKALMGIFGFYPLMSLMWAQVIVSLAISLPLTLYKYRHQLAKRAAAVGAMAITGNVVAPSREMYRRHGMPAVWIYALGWLVWLAWLLNNA